MMARFNIDEYMTVAERIDLFWNTFENGRILTELVHFEPGQCVVKAEVYLDREDEVPVTVDYAEERIDGSPVNKTSMVENCVTSAIGRAISDLGREFSGSKRPSREEMEKVQRLSEKPTSVKPVPDEFWGLLAGVKSVDDLNALWAEAVSGGYSDKVVADFRTRKEELS